MSDNPMLDAVKIAREKMKLPSDTPLTDARTFQILSSLQSGTDDVVLADFARQLETVLRNALKEETLPAPCGTWDCSHGFAVECVRAYITAELERIGRERK